METPNTLAGRLTENIMAGLSGSNLLKEDTLGYPNNYNKAYSIVLMTLEKDPEIAIQDFSKKDIKSCDMPPSILKLPDYLQNIITS